MNEINAIGIMSGSSLDGLDVCCARFIQKEGGWDYEIVALETLSFPDQLLERLSRGRSLSGLELSLLDLELGHWIGLTTKQFQSKHKFSADLIGSHGHTIFHQIKQSLSVQIGNGHAIAHQTGTTVVSDFRQQNVLLGGEGAPLVPIGDALLFPSYDSFLNLGGIANLSVRNQGNLSGGDIVPCNQVLNFLSKKLGYDFDDQGLLARTGTIDQTWLEQLGREPFYQQTLPKSIANEWIEETYLQHLPPLEVKDLLHTFCHFTADQIARELNKLGSLKVLVTGGGAYNLFLMENIQMRLKNGQLEVPSKLIIEGKEALIFAFMAVLKMNNQVNCLSSYTGAKKDICAGVVYQP